jgi:nucleotide-binding universal stress UspA family protein
MAKDMLSLLAASESVSDLHLRTRVETGMPEAVVPEVAGEASGTVLLLAAGEHGAFARSLLRRGRENVIHHLRSPFVLLPPRIGPPSRVDRAVLGMDGSALANQASSVARALSPGISIVEVEVLEPGSVPADEYLAFVPQFSESTIRMRGRAGIAILSAARAMDAGLIVVGGHGTTGLGGRHLGGTAQWLSQNADRPLLVAPEGQAAPGG